MTAHAGWERHDRRSGRGRRVAAVLAGAALALGAGVVAAGDDSELVVEETPEPAALVGELPPAPVEGRAAAIHVWTGEELVVWGGYGAPQLEGPAHNLHADGAALDPSTGRWRVLAPAPLAPRIRPAYAWSGDRLFVWGGADADYAPLVDGAAYVPADDRWEPIPDAPIDGRLGAVGVWTGEELVVLGGFGPVGIPERLDPSEPLRDGAAFDPGTGTWRVLAPPPAGIDARLLQSAVWAGDRVIVWSGDDGGVYRPADDTWEPLEVDRAELAPGGLTALAPLPSGRVAAFGVQPTAAPGAAGVVYEPGAGVVGVIPPPTPSAPVWPPRLVTAGERVILLPDRLAAEGLPDRRAVVWDVAPGLWDVAPPVTRGRAGYAAVWTGRELLVWGGFDGRRFHADGVVWRP